MRLGTVVSDRKHHGGETRGIARKLCMHSLRQYVNHQMIHSPDVHEVTRFDLLGHVESGDAALSINTSTYRDETHVAQKHAAIASLRRVF